MEAHSTTRWVIDTNCVLDLWVFEDAQVAPLREALVRREVHWLATEDMRDEFVRVLDYPAIRRALGRRLQTAPQAIRWFDAHATFVQAVPPSNLRCQDPDDQVFVDVAVAHQATLISKDAAILEMASALRGHSVRVVSPGTLARLF